MCVCVCGDSIALHSLSLTLTARRPSTCLPMSTAPLPFPLLPAWRAALASSRYRVRSSTNFLASAAASTKRSLNWFGWFGWWSGVCSVRLMRWAWCEWTRDREEEADRAMLNAKPHTSIAGAVFLYYLFTCARAHSMQCSMREGKFRSVHMGMLSSSASSLGPSA